MIIRIKKGSVNPGVRLRQLGYAPYTNREGKESFVRRLRGSDFPRLHLYIQREIGEYLQCSLHLDQAGPSYLKGKAHRADYDAPEVASEGSRLEAAG